MHQPKMLHTVTLSRSEGSVARGVEMLRCAQHDSVVTHTNAWINLLMCIIGPLSRYPGETVNKQYRARVVCFLHPTVRGRSLFIKVLVNITE
jgi:hypothetical protein